MLQAQGRPKVQERAEKSRTHKQSSTFYSGCLRVLLPVLAIRDKNKVKGARLFGGSVVRDGQEHDLPQECGRVPQELSRAQREDEVRELRACRGHRAHPLETKVAR